MYTPTWNRGPVRGPQDATCMPFFRGCCIAPSAVRGSCQIRAVHSALKLECVQIWYPRGIGAPGWFPKSSHKICHPSINKSKRDTPPSSPVHFLCSKLCCPDPTFSPLRWISFGSNLSQSPLISFFAYCFCSDSEILPGIAWKTIIGHQHAFTC